MVGEPFALVVGARVEGRTVDQQAECGAQSEWRRLRSPACELLVPHQTRDLSGRWAGPPSPYCAGDEAAVIGGAVRLRRRVSILGIPALG